MNRTGTIIGILLASTATIIWSWNFIIARGLADSVPPMTLVFWRWVIAVLVILPISFRRLWSDRDIIRKHIRFITVSALAVTFCNAVVYVAGHTSPALNMSLISISSPVFVLVLGRLFFGERLTLRRVVAVLLGTTGVVLIITDGQFASLKNLTFSVGDLWMVSLAVTFAGYTLLVRQKPPDLEPLVFLTSMFVLGLLFLAPFFAFELFTGQTGNFSFLAVAAIVYLGVGASVISLYSWNRAILEIGPVLTSFIYYSIPVFSGLEAYVVLGEKANWIHFFGGPLILLGIVIATLDRSR